MNIHIFVVVIALYFIPSIVATERGHRNAGAIIVLNIFLGWTFLGWVVALVWASTSNVKMREERGQNREAGDYGDWQILPHFKAKRSDRSSPQQ
jgi:hypothetical protein